MKKSIHSILFLALALLLCAHRSAFAGYDPLQSSLSEMDIIDVGIVTEISKVDQIRLDKDRYYTLDNVRIPIQVSKAEIAYLNEMLLGKKVAIYVNKKKKKGFTDRYGNKLAHVERDDATWVQGALVKGGFAYVSSGELNRDMVMPLYRYERVARRAKIGIWSNPLFKVRSPFEVHKDINSFQIVEGKPIERTTDRDNTIFLHFDRDHNKDFTVAIREGSRQAFDDPVNGENFKFNSLVNRVVRVRGWVDSLEGPMIEVTHPEQLEIVGTDNALDPKEIELPPDPRAVAKQENRKRRLQEKEMRRNGGVMLPGSQ